MLSGHYVVEPATESGVVITCLSEQEQTFVMVSHAVIEHRVGRGLLNGAQKRHHVVEHAMEFIALAQAKRMRFRPSSNVVWLFLRDIAAARGRHDNIVMPPVTAVTLPLSSAPPVGPLR
jgi:hypothetical protein